MITIHLTVWWVPTILTLLLWSLVAIVVFCERNDTGMLSGIGGALAAVAAFIATIFVWTTFLLTHYIK